MNPKETGLHQGVKTLPEIPTLPPEVIGALSAVSLPPRRRELPRCGLIELIGVTGADDPAVVAGTLAERLTGFVVITYGQEQWEAGLGDEPLFDKATGFLKATGQDYACLQEHLPSVVAIQIAPPELGWFSMATSFAFGLLNEDSQIGRNEWLDYQRRYRKAALEMAGPDLIVFLDWDLDNIIKRRGQGRDERFGPNQAQRILALDRLTRRWVIRMEDSAPLGTSVLRINPARLNFLTGGAGQVELVKRVVQGLQEVNPEKFAGLGIK